MKPDNIVVPIIVMDEEVTSVSTDDTTEFLVYPIVPDIGVNVCCDQNSGGGGSSGGDGTGFVSQAEWLVIQKTAGETISALTLVRFQDANTVILATSNTTYAEAKVTGIALNAATIGGTVRVLIMGIIEDSFFTYPANTLLFLGINGTITSIPPTSGYSTIIGEAPALGVVTLSIREPTIL
jgi:hypothetical protein